MTGFRLIAASQEKHNHTTNARVQHKPTAYRSRTPKCASNGRYKRLHYTHPEVRDLPPCDGCFNGINVHR